MRPLEIKPRQRKSTMIEDVILLVICLLLLIYLVYALLRPEKF
jgi:K+-transporting ATPase KdpF subunit